MLVKGGQPDSNGVDHRLAARVAELGAAVVVWRADGHVEPLGEVSDLHRRIAMTPAFRKAVVASDAALREAPGTAIEVWPGVYLAAAPERKRRRRPEGAGKAHAAAQAFLFVTPAFLEGDECRLVCDQHRLDRDAFVASVDDGALIDAAAVQPVAQSVSWMFEDTTALTKHGGELQNMGQELTETYEELSLLYKLSTNMTLNVSTEAFLIDACRELQEVSGLSWMALQLVDDEPRLQELQGAVYCEGDQCAAESVLRDVGPALMKRLPADSQPMVVDDVTTLNIPGLSQLTRSLLVVSLVADDRPIGILYGGDRIDGEAINTIDSKLCSALANSMSIFLQNVMLYDDVQGMFMGTLTALTAAIDAKDSYTRGHSERVALMSRLLAEATGFDAATVERVYISGLVHDVGKIGVPEAVLGKPGRLTDDEFALIRMHPEIGAHILKDIRQMEDLIPGVMYHHERWDGRGYPTGKAGLDIPLFGRVIGLADAFDAMSSNRTYRSALSHHQVIEEINNCAGSQFDPELAAKFVELDFDPFFDLIERHKASEAMPRRSA